MSTPAEEGLQDRVARCPLWSCCLDHGNRTEGLSGKLSPEGTASPIWSWLCLGCLPICVAPCMSSFMAIFILLCGQR